MHQTLEPLRRHFVDGASFAQLPAYTHAFALALVAVIGASWPAGDASAQLRAIPVRQVDEPGRNPYQGFVAFNADIAAAADGSSFCQPPPSAPTCFAIFPAVPAGKRLVIENLTGTVTVLTPGFPSAVTIQTTVPAFANRVSVPFQLLFAHDFGGGAFQYGANAVVKTYVEAGDSPRVAISATGAPGVLRGGSLALSGYLVDLP